MKRYVTLTAGLLIYSTYLFGQDQALRPAKKVNTIVIEKADTAVNLLMSYARHLQHFGFFIEKVDKELLTLSTDFKSYKFGGIAVVKVVAFSRQSGTNARLEIKGKIEVSNPYGGQVPFEACNCGMMGDARKNGFSEILKTLDNFPYDKIEFLIK
jgi:hypothetical protein